MKSKIAMLAMSVVAAAVVAAGVAAAVTTVGTGGTRGDVTAVEEVAALPGEFQTVQLAVSNMSCVTCPFIVKRSLQAVVGVRDVDVSYQTKIATVTFDNGQTDPAALMATTRRAGFPSQMADGGI